MQSFLICILQNCTNMCLEGLFLQVWCRISLGEGGGTLNPQVDSPPFAATAEPLQLYQENPKKAPPPSSGSTNHWVVGLNLSVASEMVHLLPHSHLIFGSEVLDLYSCTSMIFALKGWTPLCIAVLTIFQWYFVGALIFCCRLVLLTFYNTQVYHLNCSTQIVMLVCFWRNISINQLFSLNNSR